MRKREHEKKKKNEKTGGNWGEEGRWKRGVKEMITCSLSLPFSSPPPTPLANFSLASFPATLWRLPHYLRAWNRLDHTQPTYFFYLIIGFNYHALDYLCPRKMNSYFLCFLCVITFSFPRGIVWIANEPVGSGLSGLVQI